MSWTSAAALAVLAVTVAGCGGGAASRLPGASGPSTVQPPTANPTAIAAVSPAAVPTLAPSKPRTYENRYVIGLGEKRLILTYPADGTPQLPGGLVLGGVVAGAIVTYPDGSRQLADASGQFVPAVSSYGQQNQTLLQTVAGAQPLVVIADPAGGAAPTSLHVSAYASASTAQARSTGSRRLRTLQPDAAGGTLTLASVTALPDLQYVVGGDLIVFTVEGTDSSGKLADVTGATIAWSAKSGTIVPVLGTNEAIYVAPDAGNGAQNDQVSVSVTVPPSTLALASASAVVAVGMQAAVRVSGRAVLSDGRAVGRGIALFAQGNLPRGFGPNYWLGETDADGRFTMTLPAGARFAPVVGVPPGLSIDGSFDLLAATLADGSTTFGSAGAGSTMGVQVVVPPAPAPFVGYVTNAAPLPSVATTIRDAWYATNRDLVRAVTQPDSGLREILAVPPTKLPAPAAPTAVASGAFAGSCYQWVAISGVPSLVVIDAGGSGCAVPGTTAFVIQAAGTNQYAFSAFTLPSAYPVASPLNPAPSGADLLAAGGWTQAPQRSAGAIATDDVTAVVGLYDIGHQDQNAPLYNERLVYHFARNANGFGVTTIAQDDLVSADAGTRVSSYAGTRTQTAACASASSSICVRESGTLARSFVTPAGSFTRALTVESSTAGDGSGQLAYASAASGDASRIVMHVVSSATQGTFGCRVCSNDPGVAYDVDGKTRLATFTITAAGSVAASLLDPVSGTPVSALSFIL